MEANWFTSWGWIVFIVIGLLIIFRFIIKGFKNPVEYPNNFEDLILGRKVDKLLEQKNYMDEHSPESVIGDDNFKRVRFEDVNDEDVDMNFMNGSTV